jgi:hypothetical protein
MVDENVKSRGCEVSKGSCVEIEPEEGREKPTGHPNVDLIGPLCGRVSRIGEPRLDEEIAKS